MNDMVYCRHLEWEELDVNEELHMMQDFDTTGYSPYLNSSFQLTHLQDIYISRDENYCLKAVAKGKYPSIKEAARGGESVLQIGEKIPDSKISGFDSCRNQIVLEECFAYSQMSNLSLIEHIDSLYETKINTNRIRKCYHAGMADEPVIHYLTEWYINGPDHNSSMFCECTERKYTSKITRHHISEKKKGKSRGKQESFSRDCVSIKWQDLEFYICCVPKKFGPKWSSNIAVEYGINDTRIPDEEERSAIRELVGFLIGRELGLIGSTAYDEEHILLESMMCNPIFHDVHAVCRLSNREIVPVHSYENRMDSLKKKMKKLLPQYFKLRNEFHLDDVLSLYWLANTMPVGISQPVLASGIETMKNAWYHSKKSKSKGVYIPEKEYRKKMDSVLQKADEIWQGTPYEKQIHNRLAGCYRMGANEQLWNFLEELGLQVGKVEDAAWRSRNRNVHGGKTEYIEQEIRSTNVMFILFARVLLKLLGYKGKYIDYSVIGHEIKKMGTAELPGF